MFTSRFISYVLVDHIPVVSCDSDEGHLFCKECVLKYLLTKKKEYEERLRDYEVAMYEQEVGLN